MKRTRQTLFLAAAIGVASLATAQSASPAPHARPTLVSEAKSIVPGKPFTVALRFQLDPTWHVYWKNPGDSGLPPRVTWRLPPGFTAGELQYPTPETISSNGITNYVYENDVALLVEITPPADAKLGDALVLAADLKWLECDQSQCIAKKGSVEVPVTFAGTTEANEPALFAAWRDKVKAGESFNPKSAK